MRARSKLVRDLIPDQILAKGEHVDVLELSDSAFILALRQKLIEEALEVGYASDPVQICEELADLLTVAKALCSAVNLEWHHVEKAEMEKTTRKGAFSKRLYLQTLDSAAPGGAPVGVGTGLRIPLIPPFQAPDNRQSFSLPNSGFQLTLQYLENEIAVTITPTSL